ncbi:MAG: LysR family transcriptional regulator [Acidipropionibacterium sp.]|jgi:DNA-binding transcriptional LysR family regulator|nr:LysR family transcriptional regulator [Acidipropionibacterium sp.]
MDVRVLGYFLAVSEEGSFSAAAARCVVAQPSLGRQIAGLERELGERLFVRSRDGVALTEAGETLVPYARAALSAISHAHDAFAERSGLLTGTLRIGVVAGVANTGIPACAAALHRTHLGVRITMVEGASRRLIEAVRTRELDLAVAVSEVRPLPEELDDVTVMMDEVVAVAAPNGFPGMPGVSWSDLEGRPIISYTQESALAELIDAARKDHRLDLMCATNDPLLHVAMARQGAGIALTAASMLPPAGDDIDVRHFGPPLMFRKRVIWRRDATSSPPVRAFLSQMTGSGA